MFDFAWSEIALIGVVALIAIGPKDLPVAIKAVAQMVKKARRMAGEFQTHVDEMVREADLHEVREQFNDLRRMDIKGKILDAVDGDGTMRKTLNENPMDFSPPPPPVPVADAAASSASSTVVVPHEPHAIAAPAQVPAAAVPAFVPPAYVPAAAGAAPTSAPAPPAPPPPAFVPPSAAVTQQG